MPQISEFTCPCKPEPMSATELKTHLREVHSIETEGKSFDRTLVVHFNRGSKGHAYVYDWKITEDLTIRQDIQSTR